MIAWRKEILENTFRALVVENWHKEGRLGIKSTEEILAQLNPRYRTNPFFIRAGVFILTLVVVTGVLGVLALMLAEWEEGIGFFLIFGSGVLLICLQLLVINDRKLFRSGMDEGILYYALLLLISGIMIGFETYDYWGGLGHSLILLPIFLVAAIVYVDGLLSIASMICLGLALFYAVLEIGVWGKMLMPFVMMAYALAIWNTGALLERTEKLFLWKDCLDWVKWTSMVLLALAGNYLVVRELGSMLLEAPLPADEEIPLAWFFYIYTFSVPLVYIFLGLKNKMNSLLNIGLGMVAIAIISIRFYYNQLGIEWLMVWGGLALALISYVALRYWKTDKHGITVRAWEYQQEDGTQLESVIIQQTLSKDADPEKLFGGGHFGGGGTGGSY